MCETFFTLPVITGIQLFESSPYDGRTLSASLEQMKHLCSFEPEDVYVDLGYRGHDYEGKAKVHIVGKGFRKLP